jgi:hypothetical protein
VPFESVNSKVIRATVSEHSPVLARRGAMLGYSGDVFFRPVSGAGGGMGGMGGMARAVGAAMAGESNPMMATTGSGSVLYGLRGLHVTIVDIDGMSPLMVEATACWRRRQPADRAPAHRLGGIRAAVRGAATGRGCSRPGQRCGRGRAALHGGTFPLQVVGRRRRRRPAGLRRAHRPAQRRHQGKVGLARGGRQGQRRGVPAARHGHRHGVRQASERKL